MSLPFVISVPHCACRIPLGIRPALALSQAEILDSTDLGTKEIFGALPAEIVLCAAWSRLVVDLNRGPEQRSAKGVVALVDYHGRSVYRGHGQPGEREVEERLRKYYFPFHHRLWKALMRPNIRGLIDCHSLSGIGPPEAPDAGRKRKDIVLSNNGDPEGGYGTMTQGATSCRPETLRLMKEVFLEHGFSVALNDPYSGGYITTHYSRALGDEKKFAVQIEINQDLYLNRKGMRLIPEELEGVKARVLSCLDMFSARQG